MQYVLPPAVNTTGAQYNRGSVRRFTFFNYIFFENALNFLSQYFLLYRRHSVWGYRDRRTISCVNVMIQDICCFSPWLEDILEGDSNRRLSFSFWAEVKLSPSPSRNWQVLLDIFSTMDGVSNSSPNGYLWVGLSQKYQQVFFTSRTKPTELRKSVPRSVLFPLPLGEL
ncbi:hypothetical protein TNCV_2453261 [Trichonephila clavipes]|nr:hypothetical protein TNCV_2453261 [Trichonephila clavipes]